MMEGMFLPFMAGQSSPIPITEGLDPINMLTDDADVAGWNNEGLPADRMSKVNLYNKIWYFTSFFRKMQQFCATASVGH